MSAKRAEHNKEQNDSSNPKTCFVIMPIADVEGYRPGHFGEVYRELIKPAVEAAGYVCHRADESMSSHMIHMEVVTQVVNADLCVCDLSTRNPNVMFEYGIRQAFDKPTVLIRDDNTQRIFDLSIFRDLEYDHTLRVSNILEMRNKIGQAIAATVEGSADSNQLHSLVRMMSITAATLPKGSIDKEAAEFSILSRKLDRLSEAVAAIASSGNNTRVIPYGSRISEGALVVDGTITADKIASNPALINSAVKLGDILSASSITATTIKAK